MKIRNGFVSNSSSSSFIVAFPAKPNDAADVWKYMFSGKDGGISVYDYDGLSHAQIASRVFNDIEHGNFKEATKENIVDVFSGRYHYRSNCSNTFWDGKITDLDGGAWYERNGRYCGNNTKLMNELKELTIESERIENEMRKRENSLTSKGIGPQPKYAYKGGEDPYAKKPYTEKDIAAHEAYYKKEEEFHKTDKKYLAFNKERWAAQDTKWKAMTALRDKIAKEDAQNFLDDNKGQFIFIIEFSDNDGSNGSTLEHGNIFRNVPHVQISNH